MQLSPLVSVLIATYNGEDTIGSTLTKICDSTYKNVEILILDDASTDNTFQICEQKAITDPRISLRRNQFNLGYIETYNRLLNMSKGKYVIWNDQDDSRDVTFIEKAVKCLESDSKIVLCHSYTLVMVNHKPVHSTRIDSIASRKTLISRYWNFLRTFSDITIYGLIRRESVLEAKCWQQIPGSANVLLSNLLLLGQFGQIPEILFTYQGKGLSNRPSVEQEMSRSMPNQSKRYRFPWITVSRMQSKGILKTKQLSLRVKSMLFTMLWFYVLLTNFLKLFYRISRKCSPRITKALFFSIFSRTIYSKKDLDYIIDPTTRPDIYPPEWPLVNAKTKRITYEN